MGTRANIIITMGATKLVLYRHWDGYLAETGKDLAEKLKACGNNCSALITELLNEKYEATSFRDATPIYEVTGGVHGDIEWLYRVQYRTPKSGKTKVGAIHCGYATSRTPEQAAQQVELGSLEEFVGLVNADIQAMNARIAAVKKQPNSPYADAALIEEVVL